MGRGLSDLQKTILKLAYENAERGEGGSGSQGADVIYAQVLSVHYRWRTPPHGSYTPVVEHGKVKYGGQHFSKAQIGESAYRSAIAALSRAALRLEERGLAECVKGRARWAGVNLTQAGREEAQKLLEARLSDEGWTEEERDLHRRVLSGETVVIDLRNDGHPHLRDRAESVELLVYIGNRQWQGKRLWEQSKWGNRKYPAKKYGLDKCIELYERDLLNSDLKTAIVPELKGKVLGCWCKKKRDRCPGDHGQCHGDVLAKLANKPSEAGASAA